MKRIVTASGIALVIGIGLASRSVETFYDDAHYSLTYYMARSCGYTPLQAYRIASANVSIDYSALTEPVQADKDPLFGGKLPFGTVTGPQEPRVRFHAFRDSRPPIKPPNVADAAIKTQEQQLWELSVRQRNPGVYLHFLQDEVSHSGYASFGGHWFPESVRTIMTEGASDLLTHVNLADPNLPYGATTDYLSHDATNTSIMVNETLGALVRFMGASSSTQRPAACDYTRVAAVVSQLVAENKVPRTLLQQYPGQINKNVGKPFNLDEGTPNASKADAVVIKALSADRQLARYRNHKNHVGYAYNRDGDVSPTSLDEFTLYGTVQATVREGQPRQSVGVSLWAAATRSGDRPYQLACSETAGTATFTNIPVGDLIVQTVTQAGTVTRKPLLLDRLQQAVIVDGPQETERGEACSEPARTVAKQLCDPQLANRPLAHLADIQPLEEQFDRVLSNLQPSCRSLEETKEAQTSSVGTRALKGGLAAGAGIAAGKAIGAALAGTENSTSTGSTPSSTSSCPSLPLLIPTCQSFGWDFGVCATDVLPRAQQACSCLRKTFNQRTGQCQ